MTADSFMEMCAIYKPFKDFHKTYIFFPTFEKCVACKQDCQGGLLLRKGIFSTLIIWTRTDPTALSKFGVFPPPLKFEQTYWIVNHLHYVLKEEAGVDM